MCAEDEVGVETAAADQGGAEAATLAERYATISRDFRTEMSLLGEASHNEMPVLTGAEDYCATIVGQLTALQEHTRDLAAGASSGAAAARRADDEIGTGLGSVYAA